MALQERLVVTVSSPHPRVAVLEQKSEELTVSQVQELDDPPRAHHSQKQLALVDSGLEAQADEAVQQASGLWARQAPQESSEPLASR